MVNLHWRIYKMKYILDRLSVKNLFVRTVKPIKEKYESNSHMKDQIRRHKKYRKGFSS